MNSVSSIWQLDEFKPLETFFQARRKRLQASERYYLGTMYNEALADMRAWAVALPVKTLGRKIRVLFQPLAGAVQVDVALTPGGWQLDAGSQEHAAAVRQILKASRWQIEGDMYIHNGAAMGQTTLKIIDNRETGQVTIAPIRPDTVLPVTFSQYDPSLRMAIILSHTPGEDGRLVELAEVIEPERIRTYVAGKPAGLIGRASEYPNLLGEVPIVDAPFLYTGRPYGESTYEAAKQPIDGLNQQANDLEENIKKHVEPQWAAFVENPERNADDLQKSGDNVWWFPNGSDIKALVANLDIPGV
ncbi:MAG TPA: hypothetical protein EYH05_12045, partial [Anaerolineae bacterium]|nr:hypothetical protein [Anaerolineae bacterium]